MGKISSILVLSVYNGLLITHQCSMQDITPFTLRTLKRCGIKRKQKDHIWNIQTIRIQIVCIVCRHFKEKFKSFSNVFDGIYRKLPVAIVHKAPTQSTWLYCVDLEFNTSIHVLNKVPKFLHSIFPVLYIVISSFNSKMMCLKLWKGIIFWFLLCCLVSKEFEICLWRWGNLTATKEQM